MSSLENDDGLMDNRSALYRVHPLSASVSCPTHERATRLVSASTSGSSYRSVPLHAHSELNTSNACKCSRLWTLKKNLFRIAYCSSKFCPHHHCRSRMHLHSKIIRYYDEKFMSRSRMQPNMICAKIYKYIAPSPINILHTCIWAAPGFNSKVEQIILLYWRPYALHPANLKRGCKPF